MLKKKIKGNNIYYKLATINDSKQYFDWVNDKSVRGISKKKKKIFYFNHLKWFKKKIKNKNSLLLIFKLKKKPVGQVRVDYIAKKLLLTYSIDKMYRGKGYGKKILKIAENRVKKKFKLKSIFAKVVKDNIASIKIFESLYYECYYRKEFYYYKKKLN